ncbi:MAG: D-alanyl-D-alanine carboxypeptidase/D-alanyl-D-alanine-endopeptidase [Deltaproteobacteria bacterium]|nr:D-alanyl-D-alanine carboxypeptidase/D-alanyl-D-alanine-endopeptidase [Deltaproteobacteria bacterium]
MRKISLLVLVLLLGSTARAQQGKRERWLGERIDAALAARPELGSARVGIAVLDVSTGRPVFMRGADAPFRIASVAKLATTGAALAILGPEYRFKTSLLADSFDGKETIRGDLFVRGTGDPSLTTEVLWKLVGDLKLWGIKRIAGSVVIDDSFFDGETLPPGYDQKQEDGAFRAPVSAASLNYSSVAVLVQPGARDGALARVLLDPLSEYFVVENTAVTVKDGRTSVRVSQAAKPGKTVLKVTGVIRLGSGPERFRKRIEHPATYFGESLRAFLQARGIKVEQGVKTGLTPQGARLLAAHVSEPLSVLVRDLNKYSNNFMAETLLKVIGAESSGMPGSFASGITAIKGWLAQAGLGEGTYRFENGSGLYDSNQFTPRQLVALIRHAYRDFRYSSDFVAALALAGADGTIGHRMVGGAAERYVRAKTGTLDGVSCLAGLAGSATRSPLAFAVLVNDLPNQGDAPRSARAFQDEVAAALVLYLENKD